MKSLFSKTAITDADDIANDINYLFDLYQGYFVSWEDRAGKIEEKRRSTRRYTNAKYRYIVTTTEKEYLLFFEDITNATFKSKDKGLYMIQLIEAQDEDLYFRWGTPRVAGVYRIPNE